MARFESAQEKGLRPEDYDGPLWPERIAQMGQPAQFDLALSSCAILLYESLLAS